MATQGQQVERVDGRELGALSRRAMLHVLWGWLQGRVVFSVTKSCLTLVTPWTVTQQAPPSTGFPGKNNVVGGHFLLQGLSLDQGSNLRHLHCRRILYL